jgi:predicted RNA-binding Zn-ribbon protein involved in translation (DUF1610 family)
MTTPVVTTSHCLGTGTKAERKGSKYIRGTMKFLCPICSKHVGKDYHGNLNKHGYSLTPGGQPKTGEVYTRCAECLKPVYGLDYLCAKCRK